MIATITLNPSIDKHYIINDLIKGNVMRAKKVENTAGGKGLNVSRVIKLLGEDVLATGFLGGKFGEFIEEKLNELCINNRFTKIKEETRSCLAFITNDGVQTEVLEPGPTIQSSEIEKWMEDYESVLNKASIVCASGSLPRGVAPHMYAQIVKKAKLKGIKFLVDTSGDALSTCIEEAPFFIKPNLDELRAITGRNIENQDDILEIIDSMHEKGIEFVLVSLGKDGSIAGFRGEKYRVHIPKVDVVNPVGSGDSMVAGIAVALKRGYDIKETLTFASACGTANAMEATTGYVDLNNVNQLKNEIRVEAL